MDKRSDIAPPALPAETVTERMAVANELLGMYERAEKADSSMKPAPQNTISPIVSTVAFSAGLVAVIILAIQIAVMFMRYYAQLAELYDGQAIALEASNGEVEIAIKFWKIFSPDSIALGKSPNTLYEKSLDAISELAKAKAK